MEFHGFLNIDKPLGWTSHDVVGRLRRILSIRKIGHAGTLDPAATGVLIAGVGRATRFLDYVQYGSKEYVAHVVLGTESETADVDGRAISEQSHTPAAIDGNEIRAILSEFRGTMDQVPPKYSAVKQDGEPLYRKMRRGEHVEVPTRSVRIGSVAILRYRYPDLVLSIECGPGVYIRSLARDIGGRLGTTAYLHHLIRTRVGQFDLSNALDIDSLGHLAFPESWTSVASSIDAGIADSPALHLNGISSDAWYHGRSIHVRAGAQTPVEDPVRVFASDGRFAGIASVGDTQNNERSVRPRIVLAQH